MTKAFKQGPATMWRYPGPYRNFISVSAHTAEEALKEVSRSISLTIEVPTISKLERWEPTIRQWVAA